MHVSNSKKLALIAIGYALSVVVGFVAAAVNEALMPDDVAQGSPGMVAFGDMILFVMAAGFFGLAPTWFLLELWVEKAPRALLTALLLIAATGPLSWLAMVYPTSAPVPDLPQPAQELLGILIVFGAMPRIVAGPVFLVVEGVAFLLARKHVTKNRRYPVSSFQRGESVARSLGPVQVISRHRSARCAVLVTLTRKVKKYHIVSFIIGCESHCIQDFVDSLGSK